MATEVLSAEESLSGFGDAGPTQAIKNKNCGNLVTVEFTDGYGGPPLLLVAGAAAAPAEYGNNAWELFGPAESVAAMSGPDAWTNPQTFTPDYPGRYLIRLTTTIFGGSAASYTALVEVKDPQLPNAAIPAPNETTESDGTYGWSRDAEEVHKVVSRSLGFRELVSVTTAAGALTANTLVTPTIHWLTQWKASAVSLVDFNNFAVEVEPVTDADAAMATQPIFLLLEDVDPLVGSGKEKALALAKGLIPYDTTVAGITNGPAGAGAFLYADGAVLPFSATPPGVTDRKIAKVVIDNTAITSPTGAIYFDGHATAFLVDLAVFGDVEIGNDLGVGNDLTVLNNITATGMGVLAGAELVPAAANPGAIPANTLWLDSGAAGALMHGTTQVALVPVTTLDVIQALADPAPAIDNTSYVCSGGAFTVTLPPVATSLGARIVIVNNNAAAAIVVDAAGIETISGAATYLLLNQYDSVTVWCDGTEWFVE